MSTFEWTSGSECPIHRVNMRRRMGTGDWFCPAAECTWTERVTLDPLFIDRIRATGDLKPRSKR